MQNYGETIKKIRINKGLSQKYISKNILTQGNYSKIENNIHEDIKLYIFQEILNRLDISYDEFLFIHNGFKLNNREYIIKNFFAQIYNNINDLKELNKNCIDYLKYNPEDKFIMNIATVLQAHLILRETSDFTEAYKIIEPIWLTLSKRNNLYIADIFLLNNILFIFPIETAISLKKFAFRQIEKYESFYNLNRLKINFNLNLSLMYIKNFEYSNALELIEDSINLCKKEQLLIQLAISYIRKGICLNHLEDSRQNWIEKGYLILTNLDEFDIIEQLKKEVLRSSINGNK